MNIILEFFVVTFKVLWAFVVAAAKWLMRPKEKSVAGQVCLITGAGSGLGRLFALEFARRRARLVLWDINMQSNEETAGMVRHIYREISEEAVVAAQKGNGLGLKTGGPSGVGHWRVRRAPNSPSGQEKWASSVASFKGGKLNCVDDMKS